MANTKTASRLGAHHDSVVVSFDSLEKRRFFASSRIEGALPTRAMTESELVDEALRAMPGLTLHRLVHEGSIRYARELVRLVKSPGQKGNASRIGAADARIAAAFKRLTTENNARARRKEKLRAISASTLAREAGTNPGTAQRWLDRQPAKGK